VVFPFRFSNQNTVCFSFRRACYVLHPSHPPWLDPNNIWWSVQVTKLLIMQSSLASWPFPTLRSKYSPQHPALKRPLSVKNREFIGQVSNQRQNKEGSVSWIQLLCKTLAHIQNISLVCPSIPSYLCFC
jgi:hypothetical protein